MNNKLKLIFPSERGGKVDISRGRAIITLTQADLDLLANLATIIEMHEDASANEGPVVDTTAEPISETGAGA